jgi:heme-degrading monooxygenase HmoA
MVISVTSIRLKRLWYYFALTWNAMLIVRQARAQKGFVRLKNTGFGYEHYTLSVWEDEASLREFARSGAHRDAMKKSSTLATEIRTYSFHSDVIPDWKEVRSLLKETSNVITYK